MEESTGGKMQEIHAITVSSPAVYYKWPLEGAIISLTHAQKRVANCR